MEIRVKWFDRISLIQKNTFHWFHIISELKTMSEVIWQNFSVNLNWFQENMWAGYWKGLVYLANTRGLDRVGKDDFGLEDLFSKRRVETSPRTFVLNFQPNCSNELFRSQNLCSIINWQSKAELRAVCSKVMHVWVWFEGLKMAEIKHTYLA